jgi:hypothetical protein
MPAMICDSKKKVKTFQKKVAPNLQGQIQAVLLTILLEDNSKPVWNSIGP